MFGGEFVIPLFWGVILTLSLEILVLLLWLRRQPVVTPSKQPFPAYTRTESPEVLQDVDKDADKTPESCDWFNFVTDFLYQELRDTETARRLIMKQIKKEFKELLLTKTEGKMFDELKVREYNMGRSLPIFSDIKLVNIIRDNEVPNNRLELIEFNCSVDYTGSFEIGIDAVMMFGRSAYVSIELRQLKGRGRFQMSRNPFNHWSFAFLEEPQVEVIVTSRFEGRSLPHLSAFLESQFKRWIRRTHTLPNYKVRFKPFFRRYKYYDQLNDVYLHNEMLTSGDLEVKVVECSRLRLVDTAIDVYCTLSIDALPQEPLVGLWKNVWPYHDFVVYKSQPTIGMKYKLFYLEEDRGSFVIVSEVYDGSPAFEAGIKEGDIVTKIDNVKITSVEQARKMIKTFPIAVKILITVQRPTTDLFKHFAKRRGKSKRSHKSDANVEERGLEEFELIQSTSDDASSLGGVVNRRGRGAGGQAHTQVISTQTTGEITESSTNERTRSDESRSHGRSHERLPSQHKTKSVAVSQNPVWEELFKFKVSSSEYRYLNICVWSHLKGEEGDIMIGYVSISLTDLAIECSLTNSGTHQQRYVLVPAKLSKIMTSRAALKVTSGHSELPATAKLNKIIGSKKYVGDITLQFRHTPTETGHTHSTSSSNRKRRKRKESEKEVETSNKFSTKPFTADEGSDPSKHTFFPVDLKISEKKCFICHDRIWKKAWKCKRCNIVTHHKCTEYCKKMVPCHREGGEEAEEEAAEDVLLNIDESSNETVRLSTDQDWAILKREDQEEKEEYSRGSTTLEEESYSHSRMLYRSVNEGPVSNQDGNGVIVESIDAECQNVTPPESDNSSTDDENKDHESLTNDAVSHEIGSHEREEGQSLSELLMEDCADEQKELLEKILMAQKSLDLLATQKMELLSSIETSMTEEQRERTDYLIKKNEAQQETTEEILKQHKELLRSL